MKTINNPTLNSKCKNPHEKNPKSKSGVFNRSAVSAFTLTSAGVLLAMPAFAENTNRYFQRFLSIQSPTRPHL